MKVKWQLCQLKLRPLATSESVTATSNAARAAAMSEAAIETGVVENRGGGRSGDG